jgi:hypothetical protein
VKKLKFSGIDFSVSFRDLHKMQIMFLADPFTGILDEI